MSECFKCGVSGEKTRLFEVISKEGIVKICQHCFLEDDLPMVRKPTDFQLKEAEKKQTVYERLSKRDGIELKNTSEKKDVKYDKKNVSLRDLVEKNLKLKTIEKPQSNLNLINNFHWLIMRERRRKKLTQKQLAESIEESESAIRMAEQGILPENSESFVKKLNVCLGIQLFKEPKKEIVEKPVIKELRFDNEGSRSLTISDIKSLKDRKESEILGEEESKEYEDEIIDIGEIEDYSFNSGIDLGNKKDLEEKPEFVAKIREDMSQEEIDDLIFGRK